jgi:hypothetical protein
MKGNKNNRRRQNKEVVSKKVIRCVFHQKPVFEYEKCSDLLKNHEGESKISCKNCKHSF